MMYGTTAILSQLWCAKRTVVGRLPRKISFACIVFFFFPWEIQEQQNGTQLED